MPTSATPTTSLQPTAEQYQNGQPKTPVEDNALSEAPQLCQLCEQIDFGFMLQHETAEEDIGLLSDHINQDCPFCGLIVETVIRSWGEEPKDTALRLYIQSRSPMSVQVHGRVEYPEPRILLASDKMPPNHRENRAVIRELDRVKNRFVIGEIEALPNTGDAAEHQNGSSRRLCRRPVESSIDYGNVKQWIDACMSHKHTQKAKSRMNYELFKEGCGFRLIDVEDECLVLKPEPCDYVALSYVWGRLPNVLNPVTNSDKTPVLLTTLENVKALSQAGGLSPSKVEQLGNCKIPATVTDAMTFTGRIGMRYLWVDTLCIIQNDEDDSAALIRRMDDVYDDAAVTLVAATGDDADAGLRGVSPREGRPIDAVIFSDEGHTHNLSLCPPVLGDEVRSARWNTRGWTFQEQALSQRCIYFTSEELFFNCQEAQWREAYALEPQINPQLAGVTVRTGPPWWNRKQRKDLDPTPYRYLGDLTGKLTLEDYQRAVQDYSRKTLTYADDILNAFAGIFNRFKGSVGEKAPLRMPHTQGIPPDLLGYALLWFPSDGTTRRTCRDPAKNRFSSWSWASWDGPIEFVFADSMWLSRNITQALLKKAPMHLMIPCWHYGGTDFRHWSLGEWEQACEASQRPKEDAIGELKNYVEVHAGIDVDQLCLQVSESTPPIMKAGELGFAGAFIDSDGFQLSEDDARQSILEVGIHRGEFRYDAEKCRVDNLVVLVIGDTITKSPDTVSILLGVSKEGATCKRVGIGYMYHSRSKIFNPPWKYTFFRLG